LTEKKY